jgi:hypothetical protein
VNANGGSWCHYGRFIRLERGKVAEHTWVSEATKGRESIVTTTFEPREGGTLVTVKQTGIPDDGDGQRHDAGWQWVLGQLAERLGKLRKA